MLVDWCSMWLGKHNHAHLRQHHHVSLLDESFVSLGVGPNSCIDLPAMLKQLIRHTKCVHYVVRLASILLAVAHHALKRVTSVVGELTRFDMPSTGSFAAELQRGPVVRCERWGAIGTSSQVIRQYVLQLRTGGLFQCKAPLTRSVSACACVTVQRTTHCKCSSISLPFSSPTTQAAKVSMLLGSTAVSSHLRNASRSASGMSMPRRPTVRL